MGANANHVPAAFTFVNVLKDFKENIVKKVSIIIKYIKYKKYKVKLSLVYFT